MAFHDLDAAIRQRLEEGETVAEIAIALNCMRRTVQRRHRSFAALTVRALGQLSQRSRPPGDRWWSNDNEGEAVTWHTIEQRLTELEDRLLGEGP